MFKGETLLSNNNNNDGNDRPEDLLRSLNIKGSNQVKKTFKESDPSVSNDARYRTKSFEATDKNQKRDEERNTKKQKK